jgi:tetratricopeptide (TPR) repeat protein
VRVQRRNFMDGSAPTPPASRIEAAVQGARGQLRQGDYAGALLRAQSLLKEVPENRDVLYLAAVSLRYLGRIAQALETLARFESFHPTYSRLFQERGHCHRSAGDTAAALAAYRRAVELNPALPASWQAIAQLAQGPAAVAAVQAAERLAALPAAVVAATSLVAEGEIHAAERILRPFLQQYPGHIEALRILAQISLRLDAPDDAQLLLERVLATAPDYHAARYDYVLVLAQRHRHAAALQEANRLLEVEPRHAAFLTVRGNALAALGDHEQALEVFRELLERNPGQADLVLCTAHSLKTLGHQPQAIDAYREAARLRPGYGEAHFGLANLKTYRFTDAEIAQMQAAVAAPECSPTDLYHLCFALGKALEDRGAFAESFSHYARGNTLRRAATGYTPQTPEDAAALQVSTCSQEFFAARRGVGCQQSGPIFIVGLPRAGSTLLEQILASHSQVDGTWELPEIPRLVATLDSRAAAGDSPRYPALLTTMDAQQFRELGEQYLADTAAYRGGRPYFIDKMPNNFRHVGLIHLMLPNARIIDARREPMACCFSAFKQLFAAGQEFTYDLRDLGRYYRSYVALMDHWDRVLPGKVLRVDHESVVCDLESSVRRLLEFLGLAFEPACLEFHSTPRSVRTASSEQVRQPLSRGGLDQWRNFAPWLGPLEDALKG